MIGNISVSVERRKVLLGVISHLMHACMHNYGMFKIQNMLKKLFCYDEEGESSMLSDAVLSEEFLVWNEYWCCEQH